MKSKEYDFAGYVTKNDMKCLDGVTIKHGAFASSDGRTVPLVWAHDGATPENVLGNITLENRDDGVYGYGKFNSSNMAQTSKQLVQHGDIQSMSITARGIKKRAMDVVHGVIHEVSLVLAGANPGAVIDYVSLEHGAEGDIDDGEIDFTTGILFHTAEQIEDMEKELDKDGKKKPKKDPKKDPDEDDEDEEDKTVSHAAGATVGEVYATMNDEQRQCTDMLVEAALTQASDGADVTHTAEGDSNMKTHLFQVSKVNEDGVLEHGTETIDTETLMHDARELGSLQAAALQHGIVNLDILFPEAKTVDGSPQIYKDINTATAVIMQGVRKIPFSRIKNIVADFTEPEARAKGYITGKEKKEQIYKLLTRATYPQTIYKKQALNRDDVIDVEEYDIVSFTQKEMRFMLEDEIARAILVGDGRIASDDDRIDPEMIRPITLDNDYYTIKLTVDKVTNMLEAVGRTMAHYRGSGKPTMFIQPELLADLKYIKALDGRYIFGDIPSAASMADRMGVSSIVESTFFGTDRAFCIVNLNDYSVGSSKGGQVTTFDDFDIDFNLLKYLIETRISGALTKPKSAIFGKVTEATTAPVGSFTITQADSASQMPEEDPED